MINVWIVLFIILNLSMIILIIFFKYWALIFCIYCFNKTIFNIKINNFFWLIKKYIISNNYTWSSSITRKAYLYYIVYLRIYFILFLCWRGYFKYNYRHNLFHDAYFVDYQVYLDLGLLNSKHACDLRCLKFFYLY